MLNGIASLRILDDVGVKVGHGKHLHAKMMVADGESAVVGSINFSPGSFDDRRELAIEVGDMPILERLEATFERDWNHSHRVDLSKRGILKDLEHHGRTELEEIVLHQEIAKKDLHE